MDDKFIYISRKTLMPALNERAYNSLRNNTISGFTTPRQQSSNQVQIMKTEFIPAIQNGALEIRFQTKTSDNDYTTRVIFDDVEYVGEGEDATGAITFKGLDGNDYKIKPLSMGSDDIKVNCNCLDFYYRFSVWNHSDDSLAGDPPEPYKKKTNRPPVNPRKLPGVCKHLMKALTQLRSENIVK